MVRNLLKVSGRPATSSTPENAERVRAAISTDQQLTVWDLEADLGIPKPLCPKLWHRILAWNMLWQKSLRSFCYWSRRDRCLSSGRDAKRTAWGPKVPPLKGTKASLSYVQCFLYLVSSSIHVSIFQRTWLDTFWTDLICHKGCSEQWVRERVWNS